MRGADAYNESLFTTVRLEDFVPANHPVRPIRAWVNGALAAMNIKFYVMYEADAEGGRPSIAPEMLMSAMLLQALRSIRSERQMVEHIQYNPLFRWFVGLAIENKVWNHSVFNMKRDRPIVHDVVTELFNATAQMGEQRGLSSGEHSSVDGTLIQAGASRKSTRRKGGSDDGRPPDDRRGQPRSSDTHESTTNPESRLYRKSHAALALPSYLGHVLTENRHGLVVNERASSSHSTAEREVAAQMLADVAEPNKRIALGADKAYATKGFGKACREINVAPHVAQTLNRNGSRTIDGRTTRHAGYQFSQRSRKRIEQCIGSDKVVGPMRQVRCKDSTSSTSC
jgi:transposase